MSDLSEEKKQEIMAYLQGSCNSASDAAYNFDVEEEDVINIILENDHDWCIECGWFFEDSELKAVNGSDLNCRDCCENNGINFDDED